MFVFYFGIMADVTPPVGLASFAAAAVSGGDPIRTGLVAFRYSLRTVVLPFLFIFNTKLLLIGLEGPLDLALTLFGAVLGVLLFAAATQGYFWVRSRLWESAVLLVIAFTLFWPGFWLDRLAPPYERFDYESVQEVIPQKPDDAKLRLIVEGETIEGDEVTRTVLLPLGPQASVEERLRHAGLELEEDDGKTLVSYVGFATPAEKLGVEYGWEVLSIELATDRPNPYLFYLPALGLLGLLILWQRRRLPKSPAPEGAEAIPPSSPAPRPE